MNNSFFFLLINTLMPDGDTHRNYKLLKLQRITWDDNKHNLAQLDCSL